MTEAITVNLFGLSGQLDVVQAPADIIVAELKQKVASQIGAESGLYLKLSHGGKVLSDQTQLLADVFGHGTRSVDVSVVKLEGPEYFDHEHFEKFVAAVESAVEEGDVVSTRLCFSLKSLRVLDLSGKFGWIPELLSAEHPGSDCVASEFKLSGFLKALGEMESLTELDLTGNDLTSQAIDPDCDFEDVENPCITLGSVLPRTLEVLTLSKGSSGDWWESKDWEFLASGLAQGAPLSHLRELRVRKTGLRKDSDQFSENFARGLAKCLSFMPVLQKLGLDGFSLRHKHLPDLATSLPKTIRSLSLLRNFCVDEQEGADVSVKALVAGLCNLEELCLSVAEAGEDHAACQRIRSSIPKGCTVKFFTAPTFPRIASAPTLPCIQGLWESESGPVNINKDAITGQLSYVEFIRDGDEFLHGWLQPVVGEGCSSWRAELMLLEKDEQPWYGPSFGEKPETVGEVMVTSRAATDGVSTQLEMQTKVGEETEWATPVLFKPVAD